MKLSSRHFQAGIAHQKAGELGASILEYQESLRLEPQCWQARQNLALAYSASGYHEDALAQIQAALRLNPYNSEPSTGG